MLLEEIPSDREEYALYRTTITDTGAGISEEFLPHIFEEFAREKTSTDNKIEGTGLGLPIVKHLVECMEGSYECRHERSPGETCRCKRTDEGVVSDIKVIERVHK